MPDKRMQVPSVWVGRLEGTTAEGFFDPDNITVTFSYDNQRNVVWTENGESTVLEYSYRTN